MVKNLSLVVKKVLELLIIGKRLHQLLVNLLYLIVQLLIVKKESDLLFVSVFVPYRASEAESARPMS